MPAKADWPIEICPLNPSSRLSETAAMASVHASVMLPRLDGAAVAAK